MSQFHKVTLGFGNTTAMNAVFGVLSSLRDRGVVYPGEGEPAISLLHRVTSFLNDSFNLEQLVNSTQYFYSAVNTLLLHRNFVINYQVWVTSSVMRLSVTRWYSMFKQNTNGEIFDTEKYIFP